MADGRYGVDVRLGGELFTTYHHAPQHNKLFLYPVIGPTGRGLTRGYPMVADAPGEKRDHPHHKSIHVAHGDVNGVDLWSELDDHGYQRHVSFFPAFGAGERLRQRAGVRRVSLAQPLGEPQTSSRW